MVRAQRLDRGRDLGDGADDGERARRCARVPDDAPADRASHRPAPEPWPRTDRRHASTASLTMTESGVLMAWARLPTWVRARSTISRLASISALVSRASGAISTGNSPSSRSARPERMSAIDSEMRLSGASPKRTWKIVVSTSTIDERHEGAAEIVIEGAGFVENLAGIAGHADQKLAVGAEIDRPFHHPQTLALGPVDIAEADAGRGQLDADAPRASAASCPTANATPAPRTVSESVRVTCQYQPDSGSSNNGSPSDWNCDRAARPGSRPRRSGCGDRD